MIDIRGLSKSDKIHKTILHISLKNQNSLGLSAPLTYSQSFVEMNDNILFDIVNKIHDKVFYLTENSKFSLSKFENGNHVYVSHETLTRASNTIDGLIKEVLNEKNKYIILYNIFTVGDKYHIRYSSFYDPAEVRNEKIEQILNKNI